MSLTTSAAGRQVGYSTQQVRDLERLGIIPAADRGENGYRRYRPHHVVALRAYRALTAAIGPVPARRIMPALLEEPMDAAAERIDDLHAEISRSRGNVREALRGLDAVLADRADDFDEHDVMTIGELADALGVRTSALRHWEKEALIAPDRSAAGHARRYGARAISEARIVAALRAGGYPIPPIARLLGQLRADGMTEDARRLLEERLSDLTRRSVALLEASGHLHALLQSRAVSSLG
ncbi:MerR family transcriptional regulator [Microbacterium sp. ET2]|uniref:MerR family transcriptional regulator n=1 Tax=Microbacterium albipurpureum TaxID=3050384 RepID=UPI00259CC7C8|nr:MerR family transcriptional regulator [Microbacterium sp. ET2 (Ac-2212)]WJL94921.1 MerR family transcriptional regulator [Microbacterium sp. ET2 (Ac-2212)]